MHEHNPDLIAALAEGSLATNAASAAEAAIASCVECSSDLAAQRVALGAIAASAQPGLTMAESASLRRGIETALGRSQVVAETTRKRPWLALVTAGAVVIVLLAVAPLVNLLSTGSTDSAASETTVALTESATAAPAAEAPAAEAPAATASEELVAEAPQDGAADVTGGLEDRAGAFPLPLLTFGTPADLDELLAEVLKGVGDDVDGFRSLTSDELAYYQEQLNANPADGVSDCPAETALAWAEEAVGLVTVGVTELDGAQLFVVIVVSADGTRTAVALDSTSCEVVGVWSDGSVN